MNVDFTANNIHLNPNSQESSTLKSTKSKLPRPVSSTPSPVGRSEKKFESGKYIKRDFLQGTPAQNVLRAKLQEEMSKKLATLREMMTQLDENIEEIPKSVEEITEKDLNMIKKAYTEDVPRTPDIKNGENHFSALLERLDQLKDKLGGAPNHGGKRPSLHQTKSNKTFLGIPVSSIKEVIRKGLWSNWPPKIFWIRMAKVFGVTKKNAPTLYEQISLRVQRLGMLAANRTTVLQLLNKPVPLDPEERADHQLELCKEFERLTEMSWHPKINGAGVEKTYIDFADKFLTEYFEAAVKEGDEALLEYFIQGFVGTCFEEQVSGMEAFAQKHPLPEDKDRLREVLGIADYDPSQAVTPAPALVVFAAAIGFDNPINIVLDKELQACVNALQRPPSSKEFISFLEEKKFMDRAIARSEGEDAKPKWEEIHNFILRQQFDTITLPEYYLEDFLALESKIFKESGKPLTMENLIGQIKLRQEGLAKAFASDLLVFPTVSSTEAISIDSLYNEVEAYIDQELKHI